MPTLPELDFRSAVLDQVRRRWLQRTGALCATGMLGAWPSIAMTGTRVTAGAFGPLGPPDEHGARVPADFKVRLLATTGQLVPGTDYRWHDAPDGGAIFATPDGWVYVSNAEVRNQQGGVGALRFDVRGEIVAAYSVLRGTTRNCAGGVTPWGTWLSCEETDGGRVYECDPMRPSQGVVRPSLGTRCHEAAAVDPETGVIYLTEDDPEGRLYRFRPRAFGKLETGTLEAARVAPDGMVSWVRVSPTAPYRGDDSTAFARGEGAWYAAGVIYFTTTTDHRVWAYSLRASHLDVIYDAVALGRKDQKAILRHPDNIVVHAKTGALFVAEDPGDLQLVMLTPNHDHWQAAPFVQFEGHDDSEVAGPAFSPDGTRLYVSSQRGRDGEHGMTFEITGPFFDT